MEFPKEAFGKIPKAADCREGNATMVQPGGKAAQPRSKEAGWRGGEMPRPGGPSDTEEEGEREGERMENGKVRS